MNKQSLYRLPRAYDVLFSYRDYDKEVGFLLDQFGDSAGRRPATIMDFACGAANHLAAARGECSKGYGIDISEEMIEYANSRHHGLDLRVGSMIDSIFLDRSVDLAFCLLESFSYLYDYSDLNSHLKHVHGLLSPDGVYIIECANPAESIRTLDNGSVEPIEWSMRDADSDYTIRWNLLDVDPYSQIDTIEVTVTHKQANRVQEYAETLRHRFWHLCELEHFLTRYFSVVKQFGALDVDAPFERKSEKLVYVLERK